MKNRDLLIGESPHLLPVDNDEAENGAVLAQRSYQRSSGAAEIHKSPAVAVTRPIDIFILQVQDMYDLLSS